MTRVEGGAQVAQRSLLATLEITAAASAAHVLAGGHLPAAGFLFAFAAVVFGCCLATIGRFLRLGVVVPVVLAAQVGLHAALDSAPAAHHAAAHAPVAQEGFLGSLGLTPVMFWAHLITALITAILLLLQERVVAAVAGIWRAVLVRLDLPALPRLGTTARALLAPRSLLLGVSPRRGPPVLVLATS